MYKLQLVSYGLKTVSKDALRSRLATLGLLFNYSGRGKCSQATPRLLNACVKAVMIASSRL